MNILPKPLS